MTATDTAASAPGGAAIGAEAGTVLLDAQHIQKYAYDDEGRPIRGTDVLLLSDASLELRHGEVHALVGENGAGKTTLIKVIAGALPYEGGALFVDGKLRGQTTISRVRAEGIAVIWQEFSLAPHLSVVENMFLGRELHRGHRLDKAEMRRQAAEAIAMLGVSIDLDRPVDRLSTSQQQLVEIARALNEHSRILILDEPTASLSRFETERLFELLRRLRTEGLGVIFVTHRLDEVFIISDRVSILKDGRSTGTLSTVRTSKDEIVERMVGRHLDSVYQRHRTTPGEVVLETRDLLPTGATTPVSITVRRGEIVGLAGLVGAGRTELARAIVGADPVQSGSVSLDGVDITSWSMRRRLDAGMAFVPENRKDQGVILPLPILRNLAITEWPRLGPGPMVVPRRERAMASALVDELSIVARSVDQPAFTLSGGNQQRVAIGKWLARDRLVYVLDEPTRGVDVSARWALYELMEAIAARGGAVLMISSDLPEIINMSDRIYVMRLGGISAEVPGLGATEQSVLTHMLPDKTTSVARGEVP
jgi:ABC-type sugar transport system ATPase subunit